MSSFRNFSRTVLCDPAQRISIHDLDQLADALSAATGARRTVRVTGAGHSFTPLVQTEDVLLDLDGFQGLEQVDALTHEVTFRAGTRLWQVPELLKPYGLALENMGDIDRQSIAGAINTATHGTGLEFTGFSGSVTGLRLMLADGTPVHASATENPELFQAARVGLGALGVLTHVRLLCVPTYMVRAIERVEELTDVVDGFIERAHQHDHLEFFWFPGTEKAQVKINTRMPADTAPALPGRAARWLNEEVLSNGALQAVSSVGSAMPRLIPRLNAIAAGSLSDRSYTASWHRAFVSARRVRFTEMEYALPLHEFGPAFAEIRAYFARRPAPVVFPLEVRTAAADDTWLGTASGRQSVYIAVHRYVRDRVPEYFADMEAIFRRYGGRPHWGKEHSLTGTDLLELYPKFDDFREVRAGVDPRGRFLNRYLRRLLGV